MPALEYDEVLEQIAACVGEPSVTIATVAFALATSRSSIQRKLRAHETCFRAELRTVRALRAAECLTEEGMSVARTAREVGLSEDQLRRVFRSVWGIGPGALRRVAVLAARMRRWKQLDPPPYGCPGYWSDWRRWVNARKEMSGLLADVRPGTELAAWAYHQLVHARRPDYRRQPHRARSRAARTAEAEDLMRAMTAATQAPSGDPRGAAA